MKALIFSLFLTSGIFMGAAQLSTGEEQIIEYVADDYNVSESDVGLISPDIVSVTTPSGKVYGNATFTSCGTDCTTVRILFPGNTLNFIVQDELEGL